VAGEEPVTSPDQHKQPNLRLLRAAGVISALIVLSLLLGRNHQGHVEDIWIFAIAGGILLLLVADWVLRRNGLRS
jgi:tellurite resistance protein TehA-like permease